jgi:hypothetical protein
VEVELPAEAEGAVPLPGVVAETQRRSELGPAGADGDRDRQGPGAGRGVGGELLADTAQRAAACGDGDDRRSVPRGRRGAGLVLRGLRPRGADRAGAAGCAWPVGGGRGTGHAEGARVRVVRGIAGRKHADPLPPSSPRSCRDTRGKALRRNSVSQADFRV